MYFERYFTGSYRFRNEAFGPIDEDVLLHVDTRTGQAKSRWGAKMFYMPHGLTIDHAGNIWLTDIAMHQVFMFKPTDLTHPAFDSWRNVSTRFWSYSTLSTSRYCCYEKWRFLCCGWVK